MLLGLRRSLFSVNYTEFCYYVDFRISAKVIVIFVNNVSSIVSAILYRVYKHVTEYFSHDTPLYRKIRKLII